MHEKHTLEAVKLRKKINKIVNRQIIEKEVKFFHIFS